jgi:hypothetical protein
MYLPIWGSLLFIFLSIETKQDVNDYFEGKIVYKNDVIIKNSKMDSTGLKQFVGRGLTLYFKEGNYLHTYDGGFLVKDVYRKDDNSIKWNTQILS